MLRLRTDACRHVNLAKRPVFVVTHLIIAIAISNLEPAKRDDRGEAGFRAICTPRRNGRVGLRASGSCSSASAIYWYTPIGSMRNLAVWLCLAVPAVCSAQPVVWTIDPGHSSAQFSVRHMVVSNVRGEFDGPAGTVTFDPGALSAFRADVVIDARSINTRNPDRDKDLKSPAFFDVDRFPTITFTSRQIEANGPGRLKMTGALTMDGITKQVVLDVEGPTPAIKDIWGSMRIGARATTIVDRRDFGLIYDRLLESGGLVVGEQVAITIDLELTRATVPTRPVPGAAGPPRLE